MHVQPSPFDLVSVWRFNPIEPRRPSQRRGRYLLRRVQMLDHTPPNADRKADIKDRSIERGDDVTARLVRQKPFAASPETFPVRWLGDEVIDVQISIAVAIEALWSARVISWLTTLIAPAFKKLALPPFVHQSE